MSRIIGFLLFLMVGVGAAALNSAAAQPNTFYTSIRTPPYPTLSYPLRGYAETDVILCRYREQWQGVATSPAGPFQAFMSPLSNQERTYYDEFIFRRGRGGVQDFLFEASRGLLQLRGALIGWVNLDLPLSARAPLPGEADGKEITQCEDGARAAGYAAPPGSRFLVVLPPSDLGARPWPWAGKVLVPPVLDGLMHEYMHVHGLDHSASHLVFDYGDFETAGQAPRYVCDGDCADYGNPYDIMSWSITMPAPASRFGGKTGPLFGVATLEALNWIAADEIVTFGAGGETTAEYDLAPLYSQTATGLRAVRIPFNAGDPDHYYLVEFRPKNGRHRELDKNRALIYEVKRNINGFVSAAVPNNERPRGFLLKDANGVAIERLQANGVTIEPVRITNRSARIRITGDIATRCLLGFVWRLADPTDKVCVTGAARERTRLENLQAAVRRQPGGGAFGPDTCVQGYVWRAATANDRVCVFGSSRDAARADNAAAASRVNPARFVAGPNRCAAGFVYRQIDKFDHVCVTPAQKAAIEEQNRLGPSREASRATLGSTLVVLCKSGFVLREAFGGDLGDRVCVTTAEADAARSDSVNAINRLARR